MRAQRAQARLAIAGAVGAVGIAATFTAIALNREPPKKAPPRGAPIKGAPLKAAVAPDAKTPEKTALSPAAPEPAAEESEAPRDLQPKGKQAPPKLEEPKREGPANPEGFSFDLLASYNYVEPPSGEGSGIPEKVRAYDDERVTLVGYMLPIDFEPSGQVRGFFLMKDLASCCFGGAPRLNEFIDVKVPAGVDARYYPYEPVRVRGALNMGEARDGGRVSSLYQMTAELVRPDEE